MNNDLNTEERFKKAKIKLQSKNPFFSYLSLFIDEKEAKKGELPEYAGMGVNAKGELFYSKKFVDKLSDDELIAVLTHEILHLSLMHLLRKGNRNQEGWNIACDICVNFILMQNSFRLPDNCLKPNWDYSGKNRGYVFDLGKGKKIENCEDKTAEQIYDELPKGFKTPSNKGFYVVVDENGNEIKGFDEHFEDTDLTEKQKEELKDKWEERISNAYISSKQRGELPKGIERLIGKLHKQKVDWKTMLKRFIVNEIPNDMSWARRSKKSISCGVYLPDYVKEKCKICIAIDTSGSIGKEELTDFLSEIVGIAKTFQEKIDMVLYSHDIDVSEKYEVRGGNIPKIMKMKLEGGGGTSHKEITEKIAQENRNCKAVVFFTDGYSDINSIDFHKLGYKSIFVINKHGTNEDFRDKGILQIKIEDN